MITKFKLFENDGKEYETEYLLSWMTIWKGIEGDIELKNFSENDYIRYKTDKMTKTELQQYEDEVIEKSGLEWYINDDDKMIITIENQEEIIDLKDEMYCDEIDNCKDKLEYKEQQNIAIEIIGFWWIIVENEKHPKIIKKNNIKKFNI